MDVGVYDAKARFSELIRAVEAGGEVTITRHGRPVARIVPIAPAEGAGGAWAERVRALRREIGHVASGDEIVEWIREGREPR
jgi:prevent-host-death family protein